jgi:serine/threonine protein kinase
MIRSAVGGDDAPLEPPTIPGFTWAEQLDSRGGFSRVHRYRQDQPERDVAVKVLLTVGFDQQVLDTILNEANAMAQVSDHNNIVHIYAAGRAEDGQAYIVMQYCSGGNLLELVDQAPLHVSRVVWLGILVAKAVKAAHDKSIVHRDIKPANVLIDSLKNPRLTDFGISGRLVSTGYEDRVFGLSIPWSPPEIIDGDRGSRQSDIYSLGATLWHLLVGRPPFSPESDQSRGPDPKANQRVAWEDRIKAGPPPATLRPDVPPNLELLLADMLATRPGDRPRHVDDVVRKLESIQRELGGPPDDAADVADWLIAPDSTLRDSWAHRPAQPPEHERTVLREEHERTVLREEHERTVLRDEHERGAPRGESDLGPTILRQPSDDQSTVVPDTLEPGQRGTGQPRDSRRGLVWTAVGILVVAAAGLGTLVLRPTGSTGSGRPGSSAVDTAGSQNPGNLGDDLPPGTPTVTVVRLDARTLRFTWIYSSAQSSDTFLWRTSDGKRTGAATTTTLDLADPAGTQLCVQVKVVRSDGGNGSPDWSPAGCGT